MRRAALLISVLAAACSAPMDEPAPMMVPDTNWSATISANPGFGNVRGEAMARSSGGGTGVSIAFAEATRTGGTVRPWHIHLGRCESNGAIVGDPNAYSPLRPGSNGTANSSATISTPLMRGGSYYINVHESPSNLATIIACGNLNPR